MKTSESIKEIASALSKAQAQMTGAKKGSDNPFFKSKYSDLSQVVEAITEPFGSNGLSFVQGAEFEDGKISVSTRIMHSSGEWIEATTCLPPTKQDAQGYGSAISYAKRYGLQALAGVPSVDDDGNDAVKHSSGKAAQPSSQDVKQHLLDEAIKRHKKSIAAIKDSLAIDDYDSAYEAWAEIGDEDKTHLWVAPTKFDNAPFTTQERDKLKSSDMVEAKSRYFGNEVAA